MIPFSLRHNMRRNSSMPFMDMIMDTNNLFFITGAWGHRLFILSLPCITFTRKRPIIPAPSWRGRLTGARLLPPGWSSLHLCLWFQKHICSRRSTPRIRTLPLLLTCTYTIGKAYTSKGVRQGGECFFVLFLALLVVSVLREVDVLGVAGFVCKGKVATVRQREAT